MKEKEELNLSAFFTATAIFDANWYNLYADDGFTNLICMNPKGKNIEQLIGEFDRSAVISSLKKEESIQDPLSLKIPLSTY